MLQPIRALYEEVAIVKLNVGIVKPVCTQCKDVGVVNPICGQVEHLDRVKPVCGQCENIGTAKLICGQAEVAGMVKHVCTECENKVIVRPIYALSMNVVQEICYISHYQKYLLSILPLSVISYYSYSCCYSHHLQNLTV